MVGWTRRTAFKGGTAALAAAAMTTTPLSAGPLATPGSGDFGTALRLLHRYHPGLLRYLSTDGWWDAVNRFAHDFQSARGLGGQFLALSRLTASIRCGHTHCNPYNQPDTIAQLMDGAHLLPLHFEWLGERMVVTGDPHGTGLAPGTEILAIDGASVRDQLAGLLPLTRADGSLDNKRRANLSVTGATYEFYDMVAAARRQFGPTISLAVREPGKAARDVTVTAIDIEERRAVMPPAPARGSDEPLWSSAMQGRTAILTMPTWAVFNSSWDWKAWLSAQFDGWAAGGADRLVIDLRGNEGGLTEPGALIVSRLARHAVAPPDVRQLYRVERVADEDRAFLETYDESLYEAGSIGTRVAEGWYRLPTQFSPPIAPAGPRFAGKVAVLVDASNSSATGSFAEMVKRERLAMLVGQETGKNQRGLNGSAYFFARLPGGLEFDLPLVAGFAAGDPPDAGTRPDLLVERTARSVASPVDREMEAAMDALA